MSAEDYMGIFGKSNPKDAFEGMGFEITDTLYDTPPMSMAPTVYQDEKHHKWAVRIPGQEPRIFDYSDVEGSDVVEDDGTDALKNASAKGDMFGKFIENPMLLSKQNAGKRGNTCFSLTVMVQVRGIEDSLLKLPFITRRTDKNTEVYRRILKQAETVRDEFRSMAKEANAK